MGFLVPPLQIAVNRCACGAGGAAFFGNPRPGVAEPALRPGPIQGWLPQTTGSVKWGFWHRCFKSLSTGARAEQAAQHFLETQGLVLQKKNFRSKAGEIDLIMLDGMDLVFVEVRYRKNRAFGGALESIDRRKQLKIIKTAQIFVARKNYNYGMRFDVVAFEGGNLKNPGWIQNAFSAPW